jgi:hypothetical protein
MIILYVQKTNSNELKKEKKCFTKKPKKEKKRKCMVWHLYRTRASHGGSMHKNFYL